MKYKFFWSGIFSNWYTSPFTLYGIEFVCVEQCFMWSKAQLFNDTDSMKLIMLSDSPRDIKKLGRLVKNFNPTIWNKYKYSLVKEGVKAKFEQNPELKKELFKYKGYEFAEASPLDSIWGIGYDEDHALDNIDKWGENLLGKILTEVCKELSV